MTKGKKQEHLEQKVGELTLDLQRTRADFENYRKRVDTEKQTAMENGETKAVLKLLPVIDTIERAVLHIPAEIADNQWVQGVSGLSRQLTKMLTELKLERIDANTNTAFNPECHQAIQVDDATGENEVIAEELQPGYTFNGVVIRPALVKVTRK